MNENKILITLGVIVALVLGIFIGHEFWAKQAAQQLAVGAISPINTYQSNVRADYQSINASTTATTTGSFSFFNSSNDRLIEGAFAYCTGVAAETQTPSSPWSVNFATSTNPTTSNTSYAANLTLATTSASLYVSSSTIVTQGTGINAGVSLWPANTYLVGSFNATDTAICTVGVKDIQL